MEKIVSMDHNEMATELMRLNPGKFNYMIPMSLTESHAVGILTDLNMAEACFPNGYYFDSRRGITNMKHAIGSYKEIWVYTMVRVTK